jgi:hypothetical protein
MAGLINKIKIIFPAKRCPACKRTRDQAIAEQVLNQKLCPLDHCKFKEDIQKAILFSKVPKLLEFSCDKIEVLDGDAINIKWNVIDAKCCRINIFGDIPTQGVRSITLVQSESIILEYEAYNGSLYYSHEYYIKIFPKPKVLDFDVSSNRIIRGQKVKISWVLESVISAYIIIFNNSEIILNSGTIELEPTSDLDVRLIIKGYLDSEISKSIKVRVFEPPFINDFYVNPVKTIEGYPIELYFSAKNISKAIFLSEGVQNSIDITNYNERFYELLLLAKSIYNQNICLQVFDELGDAYIEANIEITVYPKPIINSFFASNTKIIIGEKIHISWSVENTSKIYLYINEDEYDVTNMEGYIIKPDSNAFIKIRVQSFDNLLSLESNILYIKVFRYVDISFSADKYFTIQSLPINIKWVVYNATEVILERFANTIKKELLECRKVDYSAGVDIYPEKTCLYRISAKNDLDSSSKQFLISVFEIPQINSLHLPDLSNLKLELDLSLKMDKLLSKNNIKYSEKFVHEGADSFRFTNLSFFDPINNLLDSIKTKIQSIIGL